MGNYFHTIAGRDHHAFFDSGIGGQIAAGVGQTRLGNRQAFTQFEWRAVVIYADELDSHEAANLCMALK
jgi:hypothetical protein